MVQPESGAIVGPLSNFLGFILDYIYNAAAVIALPLAFGLSIIIFTIIIRILLLPLSVKMHKNAQKMRKLQPFIAELNKKYTGKDPETLKKKNVALQQLYAEHKTNPLSGCLPAMLQIPIFVTLFAMFQRPYRYITDLGNVYYRIAEEIIAIPHFYTHILEQPPLGLDKLPGNMELVLNNVSDLVRLFNVYTPADWDLYLTLLGDGYRPALEYLLNQKDMIEYFLTISLVQPSGLAFPGIIMPVLAASTTFLTSNLMMKQQQLNPDTPGAAIQKNLLLYGMPVIMGVVTYTAPAGVGLYWVVSNIFHLGQHLTLNKILKTDDVEAG